MLSVDQLVPVPVIGEEHEGGVPAKWTDFPQRRCVRGADSSRRRWFDAPVPLFQAHPYRPVEHLDGPQYVVSPDGQRFLVNTVGDAVVPPIRIILTWHPSH